MSAPQSQSEHAAKPSSRHDRAAPEPRDADPRGRVRRVAAEPPAARAAEAADDEPSICRGID